MKIRYFLLSLFSVCVVALAFSCANANTGGGKGSTETDIKGVWATNEFQTQDGGRGRAFLAFDETRAYHADEKNGVLDTKGIKMAYTFKDGKLLIPSVAKMMTFSFENGEITVIPAKGSPYKMHKVESPTLDKLKEICTKEY